MCQPSQLNQCVATKPIVLKWASNPDWKFSCIDYGERRVYMGAYQSTPVSLIVIPRTPLTGYRPANQNLCNQIGRDRALGRAGRGSRGRDC